MIHVETITVESPFGVRVEQRFHRHEPASDKLMIILPGRNYTIQHPVLYHLTFLALENGYDVLPVQYGFQITGSLEPHQIPLLQEDVRLATGPALARDYREFCVVGKSLGTPLAIDLAQSLKADSVSLILLTPIGAAVQFSGPQRALAIIGTADALYAPEAVRLAESNSHLTWRVFENLNHGLLDESDWRHSLLALEGILDACETFLQGRAR